MLVKLSIFMSSMILCAFSHNSFLSVQTSNNFEVKLNGHSPASLLNVGDTIRENNIKHNELQKHQELQKYQDLQKHLNQPKHQDLNRGKSPDTSEHSNVPGNYFDKDFIPLSAVSPERKPDIGNIIYQHYNKGKDVYAIDEEITYLPKHPRYKERSYHKRAQRKVRKHSGYAKRKENRH